MKSKSGRRPPVRVRSGPELPLLPIAVGGLMVLVAIVLIIIGVVSNNKPAVAGVPAVDGIPCDHLEQTQVHYHAALQIVYGGIVHPLPGAIGITGNPSAPTCYYWLHVHSGYPNTIHIESPKNRTFTLGEFFDIWSKWSKTPQPLDATHVSTLTLTPDQSLVMYVDKADGKGPQLYTGNPRAIVLGNHEVITLEITPPVVAPPPPFTFALGL
ncbi:MAG: hypothetical protein M3082_09385 [Candidatus Dormibacteraeota bacterium]|nr:hypothetical protein [Candidatus Dormibacteraeota bacterium]